MFPDLAGQGFFELLSQVYSSGETVVTRACRCVCLARRSRAIIDFVYEPIRDESGNVTGIFVGGYEVTETQLACGAASSEERYRSLFESMGEGFCVIERNPRARQRGGFSLPRHEPRFRGDAVSTSHRQTVGSVFAERAGRLDRRLRQGRCDRQGGAFRTELLCARTAACSSFTRFASKTGRDAASG